MKALIVGYGSIAKKHIEAFRKQRISISFYALRSTKPAGNVAELENVYNWDEVPQQLDFALISNPTNLHLEALNECINRGIPVMIEKPLSNTLDGFQEVISRLAQQPLPNYVACNLRFLPVLKYLKLELSRNKSRINEVNVYCGSNLKNWRPDSDFRESYSANESQGGGVHLDLFHELDYLVWFFGLPNSYRGVNRRVSSLAIDAADFAQYQLFYPEFTATVTLNYYRQDTKRIIELVFEEDTWSINLIDGTITDGAGALIFSSEQQGIIESYAAQAAHMVAVLRGKEPSINTITQSFEILKICLSSEKIN